MGHCVVCDTPVETCECPDIEDRLRCAMKTGNAFAANAARRMLIHRLSVRPAPEDVDNWTEEHWAALELAMHKVATAQMQRNN